jgi:hypothetical protein
MRGCSRGFSQHFGEGLGVWGEGPDLDPSSCRKLLRLWTGCTASGAKFCDVQYIEALGPPEVLRSSKSS